MKTASGQGRDERTAGPVGRGGTARLIISAACLAAGALVVAMVAGGAANPRIIPGLPDQGMFTRWMLPVSKLAMDVAGVLTVGLLLAATAFLPSDKGMLGKNALGYVKAASWSALAWSGAAAATLVLTVSDTLGMPVGELLAGNELTSFAGQTQQGVALVLVVLFAVAIALFARGAITAGASAGMLVLALITLLPSPLTGHSSSAPNHGLATTSVAFHILLLALWIGGLGVLCVHALRGGRHLPEAAARFSRTALWCFVGVGLSGLFSALARLTSVTDLVTSSYGWLIVFKTLAFAGLGVIGWWHRRRTLPEIAAGRSRAFVNLATGEVLLMAATMGLAVALSRTATPPVDAPVDRAFELLGYPLPPPVSLSNLATLWWFDLFFAVVAAALAGLYGAAVVRLARRGDRWPVARTLSWFTGVVILVIATQSGAARYAPVLFSVHMAEHMVLSMLVPIFLVLGAPVTLALRALKPAARRGDRGPREWLTVILHSRVMKVVGHPAYATIIFVGSTYALYFTPLFAAAMQEHLGHIAMTAHFLAAGSLFFWVIIGVDPAPHALPHVWRLLLLFVTMPFHAFFGVALMSMTTVIAEEWYVQLGRTWGASSLADQSAGGGIAWGFGEIPTLIVVIALAFQWYQSDERRARQADRRADAVAARTGGTGDAELDAYNEYLARLNKSDGAG
ncbi:cytochrome c oxidase assembly protein [Thermopolyspora sp. NPDC052614]|uniref:cytochrome c oxidase assembly protein n=1 Tax=Thermopolyspora sp. NPDC052614 TaxID=3155682 RepID=UPI003429A6F2